MPNVLKKRFIVFILLIAGLALWCAPVFAVDNNAALKSYAANVDQAEEGMTLWEMIKAGGVIMIILLALSILSMSIAVYSFMTIDEKKLCPVAFTEEIIKKLEENDIYDVRQDCVGKDNLMAQIVLAGIDKKKRGELVSKEAMENCAQKELANLWQNIVYLSDIASVAPLIGLLGTVLGMIQAFNVIAFQTAVVKPILLAGGVSKAMVTTAGGLIVAIPTLMFYSYLRGRIQRINSKVENYIGRLSN